MKTIKTLLIGLFLITALFAGNALAGTTHIAGGAISAQFLNTNDETYILDGDVTATGQAFGIIANNTTFEGNGHTITYSTSGNTYSGFTVLGVHDNIIKNIKIVCANNSSPGKGFVIQENCNNITVENVSVNSCKNYGFFVNTNCANIYLNNVSIESKNESALYLWNNGNNVRINNSVIRSDGKEGISALNSSFIGDNITAYAISAPGVYVERSNGTRLHDIHAFTESGYAGMQIADSNNCILNNAYATGSTTGRGFMCSGGGNNTVCNGVFVSESGYGAVLQTTNGNTLTNVTCESNSDVGFFMYEVNNSIFTDITCTSNSVTGIRYLYLSGNTYTRINVSSPSVNTSSNAMNNVLVIGDSISEGAYLNVSGGYVKYLNLGNSYNILNMGVSGTSANMQEKVKSDHFAIFNPDLVIIELGSNDISINYTKQDIVDDVLGIASAARASGAKSYILSVIPRNGLDTQVKAYNDALKTQAKAQGFTVIDVYDCLDSAPENNVYDSYSSAPFIDGIHPTDAYNQILGAYVGRNILSSSGNLYQGTGLNQTVYANGTITNNRDVVTTDSSIQFSVTPDTGSVNVTVLEWSDSRKVWNESSETHNAITTHTMGGFEPNSVVRITCDGALYGDVEASQSGVIEWGYDGGFSEHTFTASYAPDWVVADSYGRETGATTWTGIIGLVGVIVLIHFIGRLLKVMQTIGSDNDEGVNTIGSLVPDLIVLAAIVVLLSVLPYIFNNINF